MKHKFDKAAGLFGDRWPGFAEGELHQWLETAGFGQIEVSVVAREEEEHISRHCWQAQCTRLGESLCGPIDASIAA